MTESLIIADCVMAKGLTCKKLWLAMMRASWAPSSSGWAWLLLIPWTNWGMLSATACIEHTNKECFISISYCLKEKGAACNEIIWHCFNASVKRVHDNTLQLCTSCWCEAVFLLEAAAFCAAAMVWVAAAAACLAAICSEDTNENHLG